MNIEINTQNFDINDVEERPAIVQRAEDIDPDGSIGFIKRFGQAPTEEFTDTNGITYTLSSSQEITNTNPVAGSEPEYYDVPGLTIYGDPHGHTLIMPQTPFPEDQGWVAYGTPSGGTLYYQKDSYKKSAQEHKPEEGWVEYAPMSSSDYAQPLYYKIENFESSENITDTETTDTND